MHAAFLDYVKQVLMPILIGDSVIMDNPAGRRLVTIVSGITDVSFGSIADIPRHTRLSPLSGAKQT
jgi:hypothetical protein